MIDKFSGARRSTMRSDVRIWPFVVVLSVVAAVICFLFGPILGGVLLGDGTDAGRAVVWTKTAANIVMPALVVAGILGAGLFHLVLKPARRSGALICTAIIAGAAVLGGAPIAIRQGLAADRYGYALRVRDGLTTAREASRRSEADYYRRLSLMMRNDPFTAENLGRQGGLLAARGTIAAYHDLMAEARRTYPENQRSARKALADAIVDQMDRQAILDRFDEAAPPRLALVRTIWDQHDAIVRLRERQVDLLEANRSRWRTIGGRMMISDQGLLNRLVALEREVQTATDLANTSELKRTQLDRDTDAGIDRVAAAAS